MAWPAALAQVRAWTWEHQALVRARGVAGDAALLRQFEQVRAQTLARPRHLVAVALHWQALPRNATHAGAVNLAAAASLHVDVLRLEPDRVGRVFITWSGSTPNSAW
ncbi:hypothetical protein [Pantoea ananatis]|uniref:hypothetical protein n=1 Tax=Pantoea ananas TaxID=553 RepID=UPI0039B9874B